MPLNSTSLSSPPAQVLLEQCCRRPWETYLEPIKMGPRVWYVSGNNWVASYLIETGDGLVLIDTAMHETAYLLIQNVEKLGFKLTDIKKILLTHAHIDHTGMLPVLYKRGFRGRVLATKGTADLCQIMLRDSAHIQMTEAEWRNRKSGGKAIGRSSLRYGRCRRGAEPSGGMSL